MMKGIEYMSWLKVKNSGDKGQISFVRMVLVILLFCICAIFIPSFVQADEMKNIQKATLLSKVSLFQKVMKAGKYDKIVDISLPPVLLDHMAKGAGISGQQLKPLVVKEIAKAMSKVKIVSFEMGTKGKMPEKTNVGAYYAKIPTETVMEINGIKIRSSEDTLAIIEEGQWYLISVASATKLGMFRSVFPRFKDVDLKVGVMERLN